MSESQPVLKQITLEIEYWVGEQDPERGVFRGGVPDPAYLDELSITVVQDESYDREVGDVVPTGKHQIHLNGSRRAYVELARYLLALAEYGSLDTTLDPDYHDHFDEVRDAFGNVAVHLIPHAPKH